MTVHPLSGPAPGYDDPYEAAGIRLLTGRRTGLDEHLARHGVLPLPWSGRGGRDERLISAVELSGLTGRGGAAFPTGRKMRAVADGKGFPVVVANGMESEPASRKDATLLDDAPHLVLDGAAVAAAAVGANTVHLCLARPRLLQAERMRRCVDERLRRGLDRINVRIQQLPHHYVSSEETALVRWLNGGDARPAATPPRPFEKGVRGQPTLVANVETLAHLALIARYGPDWFRRVGHPDAPGTALLTVTGAVRRPGVHEVPMGRSLGSVLETAGGATAPLSALLVGGFFGSWLPAGPALSVPFTRADLAQLGAGPGAGVVVALPKDACGLAETARILNHLAANSAQQCGPCRFGLPAVARDFTALAEGRPEKDLWTRLRSRIELLPGRGACRHPDGASRLAATALSVFAADAHIHMTGHPCDAFHGSAVLNIPQAHVPGPDEWR
jgi:NADH:ubiquinone oxidoreductase subunit F (NADH-binding)